MDTQVDQIFQFVILIISIVIHEIAHGYAALYYGDTTARDMGRLTLNPIKHIDIIGSIIVPLILFTTGSRYMVGWAKPVPYNPNNLNDEKKGTLAVALAGILANLSIVIVFTLIIKLFGHFFSIDALKIMAIIVYVNLVLALFNLLPVPPLDGSKIVASFGSRRFRDMVETPSLPKMIGFLVIAIVLWNIVSPYVWQMYNWLV